jgi:hypothetical protein
VVTLVVADLQIEGGEEVEQFLAAVARECSREIGQREEQRLDRGRGKARPAERFRCGD